MANKFVFNPLTGKFDIINTNSATPVIPELSSDPVSPTPEQTWVLVNGINLAGEAMGVMGLTYSGDVASATYKLSYKTLEGPIVRTILS